MTSANCHSICPSLAPILTNTYRVLSALFVGNRRMWSQEGKTQGDPLAMAMYGIGTWPLVTYLKTASNAIQAWYADDSAVCDTLDKLRLWWDELITVGPSYGYFPNASKTILLVKPHYLSKAQEIFNGKYLGGAIGSKDCVENASKEKVLLWIEKLMLLSSVAKLYPQAAYATLTHGIMSHWTYFFVQLSVLKPSSKTLKMLYNYTLFPP